MTSVSPAPNGAGFNRAGTVTVNLVAVDNTGGSGVASITYHVDSLTPVTVNAATAAVTVSGGDGTHTVFYSATDVAGNPSDSHTQTVKIDTTYPVVGASISPTPNSLGYNRTSSVTVNLSATDVRGSGVASISYKVDNGTPSTVNAATAAVNVSGADGTHTVSYSATDVAGNVTSQSQTINIDTMAPTVSSVTMANGGPQNSKEADAGDTLTIVFPPDMDPRTLCSGWDSSSASAQSASGTASIGLDHKLTFASPATCSAWSFGSVDLVSAYATGQTPLSFDLSTMTWTSGTLVITLQGNRSGTAGSTSNKVNPVYTPVSGAADKAGNPLSGSFTGGMTSRF
ncbi:OmpL47-type beta-barrel domain-containing protein [Arthrobacter sp. KNU40]|uniref:OmpL47-type beta-barrel domain-containing protein n=1 Tax=Arthrobacter sp. KNU40 TaxID=3447965 RepID=UPI003F5D7282